MQKINFTVNMSYTIEKELHINKEAGTRVYLAIDNILNRRVVIKQQTFKAKDEKQRIISEIRNQIALEQYSNLIPKIYSYYVDEKFSSIIIVMQYIEGKSLRSIIDSSKDLVKDKGWYDKEYILMTNILQSVSYLHELKSFVHKDLKPENMIVTRENEVFILDFGISGPETVNKGIGTESYMAPEQIARANSNFVGQSSDVFALAQIILEMFGIGPLKYGIDLIPDNSENKWEKQTDILRVGGEYYPNLGVILNKAISLNPKERYYNAKSFLEAVKQGKKYHNKGKGYGTRKN